MLRTPWIIVPAAVLVLTFTSLAANPPEQDKKPTPPAVDLYGDPLPEGAVGRLGTVRWRSEQFTGLQFADVGKVLLVADDYGVYSLEAATGRILQRFLEKRVSPFSVSGNGRLVLTKNLTLVDILANKEFSRLGPTSREVSAVALSPDGTVAAWGERSSKQPVKVILWDISTGKELRQLEGHQTSVDDLLFSPNGKLLISVGAEGVVRIWDRATGKELKSFDHRETILEGIGLSPDGAVLAIASSFGPPVTLYAMDSFEQIRVFAQDDREPIRLTGNVQFTGKGKSLVGCDGDGKLYFWDVATGQSINVVVPNVNGCSVSPDGSTLYYFAARSKSGVSEHAALRRWSIAERKEIDSPTGHVSSIRALSIQGNGTILRSEGADGKLLEWDLLTGKLNREFPTAFVEPPKDGVRWYVSKRSPDGRTFALSAWLADKRYGVLKLWDGKEGKLLHVLLAENEEGAPNASFSPDGKYVSSFSVKDGLRIWEVTTGKELRHFPDVRKSAYSPDSRLLLLGGPGKTATVWQIASDTIIRKWNTKYKPGLLTFSADCRLVACEELQEVWVGDVKTGRELLRLRANALELAFSPTGRILAIDQRLYIRHKNGDNEQPRAIHFCDTLSGEVVHRMIKPHGEHTSIAFSHDGRFLATGGADSTILLWDLTGYGIPGQFGRFKEPPLLSDDELQTLWSDLAGDAPKAEKAIWTLAFSPKQSMPLLKERLQFTPAPADEIAKLLAALEGPTFAERQKAAAAFDKLGDAAEAAVRKHIEGQVSPEAKQRLQEFLDKRDKEVIRKLRAIEVVEQIGTSEARDLLHAIVTDAPNPRVAEAAASALARLDKRAGGR